MISSLYDQLVFFVPKLTIALMLGLIGYVVLEWIAIDAELSRRRRKIFEERDRIRQRERSALYGTSNQQPVSLFLSKIAERTRLAIWLLDNDTHQMLTRAGFRISAARGRFLVIRLFLIIGFMIFFILYCVLSSLYPWLVAAPAFGWVGYRSSVLVLEKIAAKRDAEFFEVAPDIVDLLMICVESGMSVELALQRVGLEIGARSEVAADEIGVTVAELSYLPRRSDAFANLAARTGAKPIRSLCQSLVQADTFGTSVVGALRIQSTEARKLRQLDAERRALAIPPKLSVVMVVFFIPIIMIVMLLPAIMKMTGIDASL